MVLPIPDVRRYLKILYVCVLIFVWVVVSHSAWGTPAHVRVFISKNCPYCHEVLDFLNSLQPHCSNFLVQTHEIHDEKEFWKEYTRERDLPAGIYPLTVVGEKCFVGYLEGVGPLEPDPTGKAYLGYGNQILKAIKAEGVECDFDTAPITQEKQDENILTEIERRSADTSFWYFTSLVALADGFNPCAFTVLLILLSLLMHLRNRSLMFLIAATFVFTSAIMYAFFIFGFLWVGGWLLSSYGYIVLRVLGFLVVTAGTMSVLEGIGKPLPISFSLTSDQKAGLSRRAGRIIHRLKPNTISGSNNIASKRMFAVAGGIGGTVVLAVAANITELGCTAVLPMVFVSRLVGRYGSEIGIVHLLWIGYYAGIYIFPLAGIGVGSVIFLKRGRMGPTAGRILKLVGGTVMLAFGLVMLFRPDIMG